MLRTIRDNDILFDIIPNIISIPDIYSILLRQQILSNETNTFPLFSFSNDYILDVKKLIIY